MNFVFIGHSNADKPRIKLITDKLIEVGLTLWVDRPEEMGYKAPAIRRSFLRIRPGKPWKDEIDEAALSAGCLLLFASYRVLEEGRHHWHDEIRFGHARKTILARVSMLWIFRRSPLLGVTSPSCRKWTFCSRPTQRRPT
jgi:hypothetical protein